MADTPMIQTSGDVIASGVNYPDFLEGFEGIHVEWVGGDVILMAGIDERHDTLSALLRMFFSAYLEATGGGRVLGDPVLMRVSSRVARAPDLQILLPQNIEKLQGKEVIGVADLVVEIVSPRSQRIERVEKFSEYERGGVPEYWIIDPIYKETLFYYLGEDGLYELRKPDEDGVYQSVVLKQLRLKVNLLWQEQLPGIREVVALVDEMLKLVL